MHKCVGKVLEYIVFTVMIQLKVQPGFREELKVKPLIMSENC